MRIYSVGAVGVYLHELLEADEVLADVWIAGEITNFSRATSGHLYFTLKDGAAQVDCVMFRSRAAALDWEPREGAEVEARVLVTMYEPRGRFQLTVEAMRLGGLGPLYERFLRLNAGELVGGLRPDGRGGGEREDRRQRQSSSVPESSARASLGRRVVRTACPERASHHASRRVSA